jgi:hypothetical protein
MIGLAMFFQNFVVDYTSHKRKKRDPIVYLEDGPTIGDAEPSDIMVLFPFLLL